MHLTRIKHVANYLFFKRTVIKILLFNFVINIFIKTHVADFYPVSWKPKIKIYIYVAFYYIVLFYYITCVPLFVRQYGCYHLYKHRG